jgi:hypothetical protein
MRAGSRYLRRTNPRHLHGNVWHFKTRAHSPRQNAITHERVQNDHTRTPAWPGSHTFSVATYPLHNYQPPTAADADTTAHPSHCTVSHQIGLAPAREYTHYIHVCVCVHGVELAVGAHARAHGGAAVQVRQEQRGVRAVGESVEAHADAHGGAAVQVRRVQRGGHGVWTSVGAHARAHGRAAVQVRRVPRDVHGVGISAGAHADAFGGAAVQVRRV